jgi:hypothetical protein
MGLSHCLHQCLRRGGVWRRLRARRNAMRVEHERAGLRYGRYLGRGLRLYERVRQWRLWRCLQTRHYAV